MKLRLIKMFSGINLALSLHVCKPWCKRLLVWYPLAHLHGLKQKYFQHCDVTNCPGPPYRKRTYIYIYIFIYTNNNYYIYFNFFHSSWWKQRRVAFASQLVWRISTWLLDYSCSSLINSNAFSSFFHSCFLGMQKPKRHSVVSLIYIGSFAFESQCSCKWNRFPHLSS